MISLAGAVPAILRISAGVTVNSASPSTSFDRVRVNVIQFVRSNSRNQYKVVFINYLTKWVEVFPTKDQTALSIARLLVEEVISHHGVPRELLSDRGAAFLSSQMKGVYQLMGLKKVNTTAYHPQGDGLVERFNRTLTDMLSKTADRSGKNWDECLPYVLFTYHTSMQESTQESPFYLLHGRDPCLPTEEALAVPAAREQFEIGGGVGDQSARSLEAGSRKCQESPAQATAELRPESEACFSPCG